MMNYVIREGSNRGLCEGTTFTFAGWTDYSHNSTQDGVPTD